MVTIVMPRIRSRLIVYGLDLIISVKCVIYMQYMLFMNVLVSFHRIFSMCTRTYRDVRSKYHSRTAKVISIVFLYFV